MATYNTTINTARTPEEAFAYMADFSNVSQWDPHCEAAERTSEGEIGVGSRFHLTFSGVAGQELELDYAVTTYEPPRKVVLEAETDSLRSVDTVEVEPDGSGGAAVTYHADITLAGVRKLADPILAVGLSKAGSDARKGLEERLGR